LYHSPTCTAIYSLSLHDALPISFCGYYLSPRLLPHFTGWMTPLGPIAVLVLTMLICALLGIAIEKIAYRPLRSQPKLTVLITAIDRKSTRLNSSHVIISYAVFCF